MMVGSIPGKPDKKNSHIPVEGKLIPEGLSIKSILKKHLTTIQLRILKFYHHLDFLLLLFPPLIPLSKSVHNESRCASKLTDLCGRTESGEENDYFPTFCSPENKEQIRWGLRHSKVVFESTWTLPQLPSCLGSMALCELYLEKPFSLLLS